MEQAVALNSGRPIIALVVFNSRYHVLVFAEYLRQKIIGSVCTTCYTYRKSELNCVLRGENLNWQLSCNFRPPLPFFNLIEQLHLPRRRLTLFENLSGLAITSVQHHLRDRLIAITFGQAKYLLVLQLYGINGNVLLYDASRHFVAAFKKLKKTPQIAWQDFTAESPKPLVWEQFQQNWQEMTATSLNEFLNQFAGGVYSKTFTRECAQRLGCSSENLLAQLSTAHQRQLFEILNELYSTLKNPSYYLYDCQPPVLTFLPIASPNWPAPKIFPDYGAAVRLLVTTYLRWEHQTHQKADLLRRIAYRRASLIRKLEKQQRELNQLASPEKYRRMGDLLLANLNHITKGQTEVSLPLLNETNPQSVTIALDPRLTPSANAQRYYARARRQKEAEEQIRQSFAAIQQELQELKALEDVLQQGQIPPKLGQSLQHLLPAQNGDEETVQRQPYHLFRIDGWEILVGKSAADNDQLTHQLAHPNDLWLHAQHVTGSHVIVRNPTRKGLPRVIILKAAAIAAYYSRARHSQLVPVIYTLKKYVHKPRNSPAGTAAVQFEKVILVEPLSPKKD